MKIKPASESDLKKFDLLPDGTYPFTVLASDEIPSKSAKNKGRMMFAIKLNVHGPDGDHHCYVYCSDWFSEWLTRHFAETTGQLAQYEAGELNGAAGAFNGRTGYVKLGHENSEQYGEKNIVKDFVVKGTAKPANESKPPEGDDVPF